MEKYKNSLFTKEYNDQYIKKVSKHINILDLKDSHIFASYLGINTKKLNQEELIYVYNISKDQLTKTLKRCLKIINENINKFEIINDPYSDDIIKLKLDNRIYNILIRYGIDTISKCKKLLYSGELKEKIIR